MSLRTLARLGVISVFLISLGCTDTQSTPTPLKQSESKVENQKGFKKQEKTQKQTKSMISREYVYLSKNEKKELEQIKKQPIIYKGSNHSKKVALTFDDGPDIEVTNKILTILREHHVPATFFVTGRMVQEYPHMLKKIYEEGHVIGNHSWSHPQLTKISPREVENQLNRTNQIIEKVIGKKVVLFRPPYGATNTRVQQLIKKNGFLIINWSVDTNDWRGNSGTKIEQIVKQQMSPGGIILQHNAGNKLQGTVDALPKIIHFLKSQNYQLVTVDQLVDSPPYKENTH